MSSTDDSRDASGFSVKEELVHSLYVMCLWSTTDHIHSGALKYSHGLMVPVSAIRGGALPLYIHMFSGHAPTAAHSVVLRCLVLQKGLTVQRPTCQHRLESQCAAALIASLSCSSFTLRLLAPDHLAALAGVYPCH